MTAFALSGKLSFDPRTDFLKNANGEEIRLPEPKGEELPPEKFIEDDLENEILSLYEI